MSLLERFAHTLEMLRPGPGRALVAVSGGLDSVVLLDLLVETWERHGLELIVAHVDHGIHPESPLVAHEVEALAARLGLRSVSGRLALGVGASETRARAARYRWLRDARRRLGARWIVTAHQADDQRETILMRMLRGSGPLGLAGMRIRDKDILRPLLPFSRRTLTRYARLRGLRWWNDPANQDPGHLRSWIRGDLLPTLAARLPDLHLKLAETRRHALRDRQSWDAALQVWPHLDPRHTRGETSAAWAVLSELPEPLAAALAEALVRRAGGPAGPARLRRALLALADAPSGASADLGQGWRLELAFGRLRVIPPAGTAAKQPVVIDQPPGESAWGLWRVRWTIEPAPARQSRNGRTAWFIPGALALRGWRPGDRLAPLGGRGHRLAVRCFQDARIPRSERRNWPMVEGGGDLAWIPGVCRSGRLLPAPGAPALRVDVEPRA
jgi:tRNA(Ile)-lysidine synthase